METSARPPVHLFVRTVTAVNPYDGGLITVLVGVRRWPAECLRPVRGKALGMLGVISVAEPMATPLFLEDPPVPRAGQPQQAVATTGSFVNRLHNGYSGRRT